LHKNSKLPNFGVRLDSGDFAVLSQKVRKILDEAGYKKALIMASNELDEIVITDLKRQGACIDVWAVGTHLVTGQTQPALDGVYKLSAIRKSSSAPWIYKVKKSEQIVKVTDPGLLQVRRFSDSSRFTHDVIYNVGEPAAGFPKNSEDLLKPTLHLGKRTFSPPTLIQTQKYAASQLEHLSPSVRRFLNPEPYPVELEKSLLELKTKLLQEVS
jgi:nicotinate phosphoribosyltransferase